MNSKPTILYVEDESSDAGLLRLAFKRAGMPDLLRIAADGAQAIEYLAGTGPFCDRVQHPLPALVLLDLHLPRKSGFEVLTWIRQQPQFAELPIIIYTSPTRGDDQERTRALGATDYIVKPAGLAELIAFARKIAHRWVVATPCPSP